MSISIVQSPQLITPSDNHITFTFKQSDTYGGGSTKYNISFVIDVNVSGYGVVGTYEVFPEEFNSGYWFSKIDLSSIVRNYISEPRIKPQNNTYSIFDPNSYVITSITVTEKYATTLNGNTILGSSVTSGEIGVFKASLDRNEFYNWDYTKYNKGATDKRFLTDRYYESIGSLNIYSYDFKKDDTFSIGYLDSTFFGTQTLNKLSIVLNDNDGNIIKSYKIDYTTVLQGIVNFIYFNLQHQVDLGNITSLQRDSTTKITLSILDSSNVSIMPIIVLNCLETCYFKGRSIHFLNKYGAYDYFCFQHNERFKSDIKTLEYTQPEGQWNEDMSYTYNPFKGGRKSYAKDITKKAQISSDYLTEKQQNWLVQLYESPLVIYNEGQEFENVIVTNSAYEVKQDEYDELYNEIIDIEFTNKKSITL